LFLAGCSTTHHEHVNSTVQTPSRSIETPELKVARVELAEMRERYTDQHLLVQNQLKKIAALEKHQGDTK